MGDASSTKEDFLIACGDMQKEPNSEILAILNLAIDDSIM